MPNLSYDDITSASARLAAKRVWESLRHEAISSHAKQLWPDGAAERISMRLLRNTYLCPATGCALWALSTTGTMGYGQIMIEHKPHLTHRTAWLLFVGDIVGLCVLHKCDTPTCANPAHLFLGTRADNMLDMCHKQRGARKLMASEVLAIRARYKPRSKSDGMRALAQQYGMSYHQIAGIIYRADWRWLPDLPDAPTP